MSEKKPLQFCLLQARKQDDPVRIDERLSFAERMDVSLEQVDVWDLLSGAPDIDRLESEYDGLLVGGSGDYSTTDPEPWIKGFIDTMGMICDRRIPTFASCFGFQGMVISQGGTVRRDEAAAEVGTYELERVQSLDDDPLFGHLPHRFVAQQGHKDRVIDMPSGLENLIRSERCPYQAVRVKESLVYGVQFHPELTGAENKARFARYYETYVDALGYDATQQIMKSFMASPDANEILLRFKNAVLDSSSD